MQEELAFESRLHRTDISAVERGVRKLTVTVDERMAKALKVPMPRLLDEGGCPPISKLGLLG